MACHDEEVPPEMQEALAAQQKYKQVEIDVIAMRTRARAGLGRAVFEERARQGKTQDQAASELGVVVEQVRRYEREWRIWQREHPGESP